MMTLEEHAIHELKLENEALRQQLAQLDGIIRKDASDLLAAEILVRQAIDNMRFMQGIIDQALRSPTPKTVLMQSRGVCIINGGAA